MAIKNILYSDKIVQRERGFAGLAGGGGGSGVLKVLLCSFERINGLKIRVRR
jgi:hypothetical protein